jgi:hypothetical protein
MEPLKLNKIRYLKCIPEYTQGADASGHPKARQVDGLKSGLADLNDSNSTSFALRCPVHVELPPFQESYKMFYKSELQRASSGTHKQQRVTSRSWTVWKDPCK